MPARSGAAQQGEDDARVAVRQQRRAGPDEARAEVGDGGAGPGGGGGEVVAALLVLLFLERDGFLRVNPFFLSLFSLSLSVSLFFFHSPKH